MLIVPFKTLLNIVLQTINRKLLLNSWYYYHASRQAEYVEDISR